MDNDAEGEVPDRLNLASNLQTVCAQTYQNYKSAVAKGKVALEWPAVVEEHINQQIASSSKD